MASYEHPYVPRDLKLPGYVPLSFSQADIVLPFLGSSLLVAAAVWVLSGRFAKVSKTDRIIMCWWAIAGLIHIILEGYYTFVPDFFKKKTPFYLAELWKEFSKGDSRYVGRDSAIVALEGITAALEGPTSLLAVYAIASRKSYRYILQFAVCMGQLYGCLIYYVPAYLEGDNLSISLYYFCAYFIGANIPWVVIPTLIAIRCWKKIIAASESENNKNKPE